MPDCPEYKVYISLPHYGDIVADALPGLMLCTDRHRYYIQRGCGSLLALNFNQLWATMMNSREEQAWTHFAMHHADIAAPPGWLDVLTEEMDRVGADVLSACIAIKDSRGVTSTGWMNPETGQIRRFTMTDLHQLPETFDAAGSGHPDDYLMINTGLWVCRLGPWIETFPGFTVCDSLQKIDGRWRVASLPEDWGFSRWAAQHGLKVFATRKVKVTHWGRYGFANDSAWGEWETDRGDDL